MSSSGLFWLFFVVVLAALASCIQARPSDDVFQVEKDSDAGMNDAIKYLEELDKYYSQVARPRYRINYSKLSNSVEQIVYRLNAVCNT